MTLSRALLPLLALAGGCTFGTYGPAFDPDVCLEEGKCDDDNDGFAQHEGDCDDADPLVHPEGVELCDGMDNDCDDAVDEDGALDAGTYYRDLDGDGYGDLDGAIASCEVPSGYVQSPADCDDTSADAYPGGTEVCDGMDNDCDGNLDEGTAVDVLTFYADTDGDGFGSPWDTASGCEAPAGHVDNSLDCDDDEPTVYVGAPEICDGMNTNCDAEETDAGVVTWFDEDGGPAADLSATFAAGSAGSPVTWSAVQDGTLRICSGTYFASLSLLADSVVIEGLEGAAQTTLAGGQPAILGLVIGQSVVVRGLTISGGSGDRGGGISAQPDSALSVESSVISGNQAREGAGVYLDAGATLTLTDALVEGNVATELGGGICASGAAVTLHDSTIRDNQAATGGGAALRFGASLEASGSSWSQNEPEDVWMTSAGISFQAGTKASFTCQDEIGCD